MFVVEILCDTGREPWGWGWGWGVLRVNRLFFRTQQVRVWGSIRGAAQHRAASSVTARPGRGEQVAWVRLSEA